jgi:hypothetical protein
VQHRPGQPVADQPHADGRAAHRRPWNRSISRRICVSLNSSPR